VFSSTISIRWRALHTPDVLGVVFSVEVMHRATATGENSKYRKEKNDSELTAMPGSGTTKDENDHFHIKS